ncbi:hypothetical protein D9B87_12445, partial [Corynebacterium diphtheriae]
EGGNDKQFNGHRKDTLPIVDAIKEKGWHAEVCVSTVLSGAKAETISSSTVTVKTRFLSLMPSRKRAGTLRFV